MLRKLSGEVLLRGECAQLSAKHFSSSSAKTGMVTGMLFWFQKR